MNYSRNGWTNIRGQVIVWKHIAFMRWSSTCPLYHILIWLLIGLTVGTGHAQNRVLQLDGEGDYVQLPSDIFSGLNEATVEAWIKWDAFGSFSQPWGFGSGQTWNVMALNNQLRSNTLQFFIYEDEETATHSRTRCIRPGQVVSHCSRVQSYRDAFVSEWRIDRAA